MCCYCAFRSHDEVQLRTGGSATIPIDELKAQTRFGGYRDHEEALKLEEMFWSALGALLVANSRCASLECSAMIVLQHLRIISLAIIIRT
eukprot:COSAG06_NODE_21542_length_753_cov_1.842508_1_plen_90_part_00